MTALDLCLEKKPWYVERVRLRAAVQVSVFDSGFILGDAVWEGLRLYNGKWFCLDMHLKRLYEACKYMCIPIGVCLRLYLRSLNSHVVAGISPDQLSKDLYKLVEINQFKSGVHARLMATQLRFSDFHDFDRSLEARSTRPTKAPLSTKARRQSCASASTRAQSTTL